MFSHSLTLQNERALLKPLEVGDFKELSQISNNEAIWKLFSVRLTDPRALKNWILAALKERNNKTRVPFAIIDKKINRFAGSTSYGNISIHDKRLEIGWTWLGKEFQGTGLNKHCKFLLLRYAFEDLEMERVEFKTDVLNSQSRRALKKIGCVEEGILRSHMLMQEGRRRDSIYYSILRQEWEGVKKVVFAEVISSESTNNLI